MDKAQVDAATWRPLILKHAVERYDKILYVDNKFVLDGNLDAVIAKLNHNGAYFVKGST